MLKLLGNLFKTYFLHKRVLRIACVLIIALLLVIVYFSFIAPIVSICITTTDIHAGTTYLQNKEYLEFESGKNFDKILTDLDCLAMGTVIDFYHVDNHIRDNPIYGKMFDVFAVDISLMPQNYIEQKRRIQLTCDYCCSMYDYELYLSAHKGTSKDDVVLIAFADSGYIVRYILLTDKDPVSLNSSYGTALIQQSSLKWDILDGS